jgi:hypothetical protein
MNTLTVWITRPNAYEILMGGERDLRLWLVKPHYSHRSWDAHLPDVNDMDRYRDEGWSSESPSVRVKPLLRQHQVLRDAVWREVFVSVCPKGMDYEQGDAWHRAQRGDEVFDGKPVTMWHELSDDKLWEAKCNTPMKRFLLEVDLLTLAVRRVAPMVIPRSTYNATGVEWAQTDEISPELATEVWHPCDPATGLPA